MKLKITMLLAALLAVGLIAAGCGDDDDSGDDSSTTESTSSGATDSGLTKAEFLVQGNAVCKEGNEAITQAFDELNGQSSEQDAETVVTEAVVPAVQSQIDGIRDLGVPAGDEDEVNAILDAAQAANDELAADPAAVLGDGPQQSDPFAEANQLAADYGLTECAS